jgi:hypothetical protein
VLPILESGNAEQADAAATSMLLSGINRSLPQLT